MSIQELEAAVAQLSQEDLAAFGRWSEEYFADEWDSPTRNSELQTLD